MDFNEESRLLDAQLSQGHINVEQYEAKQRELLSKRDENPELFAQNPPLSEVKGQDASTPKYDYASPIQPHSVVPEQIAPSVLTPYANQSANPPGVQMQSKDVNQWCMFTHLSSLCGFVIPFGGFIVPIVLWQVKKNESPVIDRHGKTVANWLITLGIGVVAIGILEALAFALAFIPVLGLVLAIGIQLIVGLLGLALLICNLVFSIMGGLKANNGEEWSYPFSLKLIQ